MRKLIAAFKMSIDGKVEGRDGYADWVDAWSEDYGLTPQIDACLLGGHMYPGYEQYWTAIQNNEPNKPLQITGRPPAPAELEWARFAALIPHYVFSNTLTSANWKGTRFLRTIEEIGSLKQQPGKDIYLTGGAQIAASLIDAGLVDELRLVVCSLIVGEGKSLFATTQKRRALELRETRQLADGRVSLLYRIS